MHKYVLNYQQIENIRLLGSVTTQPPSRSDVKKILRNLKEKKMSNSEEARENGSSSDEVFIILFNISHINIVLL